MSLQNKRTIFMFFIVSASILSLIFLIRYNSNTHAQEERTADISIIHSNDTASFLPPPTDITQMINKSDLIIIGTIDSIVNQGHFDGYDQEGNVIKSSRESRRSLPITDFQIKVEQVLYSKHSSDTVDPIILRMLGDYDQIIKSGEDAASYFPISRLGERRVFFLSKNPDATYGLYYGPWGRLIIDNNVLKVSSSEKSVFKLSGDTYTVDELETAINETASQEK